MTGVIRRDWKRQLPILLTSLALCLWTIMAFAWLAQQPVAVGHIPVAVSGQRGEQAITADGVLFDAWSPSTAQIDPNARLIAIDGEPLSDIAYTLNGINTWQAGNTQQWIIEQNGQRETVTVELLPNPVATTSLLIQPLRYLFVTLFVLLCAVLFVRRTDNPVTALLLLFSCAIAAYIIVLSHRMRLHFWVEPASYFAIAIPLFMLPKLVVSIIHHLLLVYPLPSPRFAKRPLPWLAVIYGTPQLLMLGLIVVLRGRSAGNGLVWFQSWFQGQQTVTFAWLLLAIPLLVLAGRRSRAMFEAQMQFRIFVAAILSYPLLALLLFSFPSWIGVEFSVPQVVRPFLFLPLIVGLYVAITRFRLFDIDRLLNRTLVYGLLTGLVGLLYFGLVAAVGLVLQQGRSPVAAVGTAIVVALLLRPVRAWVQNGINRLMYGQRNDPFAVLSEVDKLLTSAGTTQGTAQQLAQLVQTSLRLPFVQLVLESGRFEAGSAENLPTTTFPLQTATATIGQLHITQRDDLDRFTPTEIGLLETIARQAATAFHSRQLAQALSTSSKTAREDERKQLQRDLHDNLGPTLASMRMQLDMAQESLTEDPALAQDILSNLRTQTDDAVQEVRGMLVKNRPKPIAEKGLVNALSDLTEQFTIEPDLIVTFEPHGDLPDGLPADVETVIYQLVSEALGNVIRHAEASRATVVLDAGKSLRVIVDDNGIGVDNSAESGIGTISLRRRVEQLDGTFALGPSPLGGVQVVAELPL